MDTAQRLRMLREEKGLSQDSVANALGIDRTTYVKYEHGGSIKQSLQKLADFFEVSTDYLLARNENPMMLREHTYEAPMDIFAVKYSTIGASNSLTCSELEHMEKYRAITQEQRDAVDCLVEHYFNRKSRYAGKNKRGL